VIARFNLKGFYF